MNNEMAEAGDGSLVIQPSDVPERYSTIVYFFAS